jgi:hypothetical protein
MAPVVRDVPWSQHTLLQVHDPTSPLKMGPTTLSMVPPGRTGASAPQEPYVDHLTSDAYYPQPLLILPWQRGKAKDVTLLYYKTTGQSTVSPQET